MVPMFEGILERRLRNQEAYAIVRMQTYIVTEDKRGEDPAGPLLQSSDFMPSYGSVSAHEHKHGLGRISIDLQAGGLDSKFEGQWHTEGTEWENIEAVGLYYLHVDKRLEVTRVGQLELRDNHFHTSYQIPVRENKAVVFSNWNMQHRMGKLYLPAEGAVSVPETKQGGPRTERMGDDDAPTPARRTVLALFLCHGDSASKRPVYGDPPQSSSASSSSSSPPPLPPPSPLARSWFEDCLSGTSDPPFPSPLTNLIFEYVGFEGMSAGAVRDLLRQTRKTKWKIEGPRECD
eukprot:gb/GEZN01008380.1/.p1 GENE.gb/GEZN01008380.1/~~gb/GEZN01008380.1/.p1  ORF type:complete len:290 (+),score=48.78 gb/GEZN01008380.1/:243-1112(+)